MEMDQATPEEVLQLLRFDPDPFEAITYYLPRLISGEPMPLVDPLIHRTDVYVCEPRDLAAKFAPVPQCGNTGDRFFFTPCKRLKGGGNRSQRTVGVGDGTWSLQHTKAIQDGLGAKVGEHKTLVFFRKGDEKTEWLMDEYRCFPCPEKALVAGGEMVMCKIHVHVSPKAAPDSEARQLSAPKVRRQQANRTPAPHPAEAPVSTPADKRPAPVATDQPCPKKMRHTPVPSSTPPVVHLDRSPVCVPPPAYAPPPVCLPDGFTEAPVPSSTPPVVHLDRSPVFVPPPAYAPPPVCLPDAFTEAPAPAAAEGDDGDMNRFVCTMDELLGVCGGEEEEEAANVDTDQFATTLKDARCGAQEEEAVPGDDKEPEQLLPPAPFTTDELSEIFFDELPENFFPLIDDLHELNDFSLFATSSEDIFGGGEILQQQQAVSTSEELLVRYKARPMFTPDQLEGHSEFLSYA